MPERDGLREDLPLSPQDFFVLSRIEGATRVSEVIASSGLDSGTVTQILQRLLDLGVVRKGEGTRSAGTTRPRKRRISHSRRKLLAAQLTAVQAGARAEVPDSTQRPSEDPPARVPGSQGRDTSPNPEGWPVDLVSEDDPRIDPKLDLPVKEQRLVLSLHDQLEHLSAFDLLGIEPTHDVKAIRGAFLRASRHFHPDRYYGRDLGPFKARLSDLFKRAKRAHEALLDPARREPYVAELLARREAAEAAERAAAERAAAEQRAREEAASAEARAARAERDRRRRERQQGRLREQIRAKAREHFRAGETAEARGDLSGAVCSYRIAMEMDPGTADFRVAHERVRGRARAQRVERDLARAENLMELGQVADAARFFRDAANLDPTPLHLARAAWSLSFSSGDDARTFAIRALDALEQARAGESGVPPEREAHVRALAAHGFAAAKQVASAREQAREAERLAGESAKVRALLKTLNLD